MWLILFVILLTLTFIWIQRRYSYWSKQGVPGPKPLPFVGNYKKNVFGELGSGDLLAEFYREYEDYPFFGIYRATTPVLVVRDPDFVKNVVLKDFKNFHDNELKVNQEVDPILGRNPFVMKGIAWKNTRAQLTSCFTSGKIKGMYQFLERTSERLVQFIEEESKISNGLEARDFCLRFTLDNVAACAFGLEGKAFEKTRSQFRELADNFVSPDGTSNKLLFAVLGLFPNILNSFSIKFVAKEVEDQLFGLIRGSLKYRKENNILRNDFLDAMNSLHTEGGIFQEIDIVAHAASFFGDGYETSSRVMSFLLFELASNPVEQEKLRDEIKESIKKNNDTFSYEIIHDMPYLDACLNESLRKNSVVHQLNKVCTESYTYTPTDPRYKKVTVTLKPGDCVAIPVTALQLDPEHFEEPDKFIPERFLVKENIPKFAFLPFGDGPRACLGMRFAQTQIKVGVANIIKNFRLSVNPKTEQPFKYDPYYIMRHVIGGLWLNCEKI